MVCGLSALRDRAWASVDAGGGEGYGSCRHTHVCAAQLIRDPLRWDVERCVAGARFSVKASEICVLRRKSQRCPKHISGALISTQASMFRQVLHLGSGREIT